MLDKAQEFDGFRYSYVLRMWQYDNEYHFEIEARDKNSRLRSSVTNLNYLYSQFSIMGEAEENDEIERFMDSEWILRHDEVDSVWNDGIELFSDKESIISLEKALDGDRQEGEWASYY